MLHSGLVKKEFSQSAYQILPYWKSWGSKNKSFRYEALVEEVHETDSTESRENELKERIPVPHDNFFKSI